MKFSIFHFFAFIALIALQMSHSWLVVGGMAASFVVLALGVIIMLFYSFRKYTNSNRIPEIVEGIMALCVVNLVTMWIYFLCSGDPLSLELRGFVDAAIK